MSTKSDRKPAKALKKTSLVDMEKIASEYLETNRPAYIAAPTSVEFKTKRSRNGGHKSATTRKQLGGNSTDLIQAAPGQTQSAAIQQQTIAESCSRTDQQDSTTVTTNRLNPEAAAFVFGATATQKYHLSSSSNQRKNSKSPLLYAS
jgi:hypothetical protein